MLVQNWPLHQIGELIQIKPYGFAAPDQVRARHRSVYNIQQPVRFQTRPMTAAPINHDVTAHLFAVNQSGPMGHNQVNFRMGCAKKRQPWYQPMRPKHRPNSQRNFGSSI